MKLFKNKKIWLILILLLAAFLRLWDLGSFPAGLNADEAAIGYNAYSLWQTGKDEHGNAWPLHFKSFGDYKPGFYFYLVLPLVKILGLNIWAVRLPSACLGVLAVWLLYLLVKELFVNESWALLAALFLAISPWHLHFSRGGWETNTATTFILAGVYFFYKGIKKSRFWFLSVLFFVFSLYTYHSARILSPLLGFGLLLLNRKKIFKKGLGLKKWPKNLLFSGVMGLVLVLPLVLSFLGPAGASRFAGVGLLADTGPLWRVNELRGQHANWASPLVRAFHNKVVAYGIAFFENWLDHFHGEFLFVSGDVIERSRVPETGQLYLYEIPLVFLGIYWLLKNRPKNWELIFIWLGVAPLAAAMTFQTPHALRALTMVLPLAMISNFGAWVIGGWLKRQVKSKKLFKLILGVSILVIGWNFGRYLHQYYVHYPQTYPTAWEDGFEDLIAYVQSVEGDYNRIYVTDRYDQPYIIFLFYLKYPPEKFQQEVKLTAPDEFGFSTVRDFGKFHFEAIKWEELRDERGVLIIGAPGEIPDEAHVSQTINFRSGQPAFEIVSL